MKQFLLFAIIALAFVARSYSQQVNPANLTGTWDQNIASHAATIIFDDTVHVRFSYKGHPGSTRKYYYLVNSSQTPAILTVDYKANHKKHRNEYLVQLVDSHTMKLQVLEKKDDRQHFDQSGKGRIITLQRRA